MSKNTSLSFSKLKIAVIHWMVVDYMFNSRSNFSIAMGTDRYDVDTRILCQEFNASTVCKQHT